MNTRFITLAKITRLHGFPREGFVVLKAELFNKGGEIFRDRASAFFLNSGSAGGAPTASPNNFHEITFATPPDPWGGAWGEARGLLLKFKESEAPPMGAEVALPREAFPALQGHEVYICDLMGLRVVDQDQKQYGRIVAFYENKAGQVSLEVRSDQGRAFQFPVEWIEGGWESRREELARGILRVDDLAAWAE